MKKYIPFLVISIILLSCEKDDSSESTIALDTIGILGNWELSSRGINNVSSTETMCCEFLDLQDDANHLDLIGHYNFESTTTTTGVFSIDLENTTLTTTTQNNATKIMHYNLNVNTLELWYFEDNNRYWTIYQKN